MNWKVIIGVLIVIGIIGGVFGYAKYQQVFAPNVPNILEKSIVEIPTGSSYKEIVDQLFLEGFLEDTISFNWVADKMKYPKADMRTGRFEIKPNWNNRQLIQHLRNGKRATVKVVLTNERLIENVAAKVARFIEPDSTELLYLFNDDVFLEENGFTKETLIHSSSQKNARKGASQNKC